MRTTTAHRRRPCGKRGGQLPIRRSCAARRYLFPLRVESCAAPRFVHVLRPANDSIIELPLRQGSVERDSPDPAGFDRFLRDHYQALLQFLRRRTVTTQDAEDAAQESLSRLLRYRESQPPAAWRPLLFRIAANVANDQARRAHSTRSREHVPFDEQEVAGNAVQPLTPDRILLDQRQLAQVLQAIRRLPDKCRNIFLLSRFQGMSNRAIAERCGISVRMVEKQITKALAACRAAVRESGP